MLTDRDEQTTLYRSVTATRRLLVVLDNAYNGSQVRSLLPTGAGCDVLITSRAPQVNENAFTNQFTDLGAFMARSDGSLPVPLEDLGPAGQYVAADALAFILDANCVGVGESGTGLGNVYQSNQIGPGSPPSDFSTTNPWYTQLGHGYTQHELWTYDNGSTADSTATWTTKARSPTPAATRSTPPPTRCSSARAEPDAEASRHQERFRRLTASAQGNTRPKDICLAAEVGRLLARLLSRATGNHSRQSHSGRSLD